MSRATSEISQYSFQNIASVPPHASHDLSHPSRANRGRTPKATPRRRKAALGFVIPSWPIGTARGAAISREDSMCTVLHGSPG